MFGRFALRWPPRAAAQGAAVRPGKPTLLPRLPSSTTFRPSAASSPAMIRSVKDCEPLSRTARRHLTVTQPRAASNGSRKTDARTPTAVPLPSLFYDFRESAGLPTPAMLRLAILAPSVRLALEMPIATLKPRRRQPANPVPRPAQRVTQSTNVRFTKLKYQTVCLTKQEP